LSGDGAGFIEHCLARHGASRGEDGAVVSSGKVHEGGLKVQARRRGGWRFVTAEGEEFFPVRRDPRSYYLGTELEETHRAQGLEVTDTTAATRWRGERMDYDHGVMLLCHKAERAREVDPADALDTGDSPGTLDAAAPDDTDIAPPPGWPDVSAGTSPPLRPRVGPAPFT
jgi:hypothetical protein